MIQAFDNEQKSVDISVSLIPELKKYLEHRLSKGDTIVCFIDTDKYDMEDSQFFYDLIESVFPNNQILILPKDVEIGVIKDDN